MPDWQFPNSATPPGSAAYYAVRFSAPERHDELAAAFAWRVELDHIVAKAQDPGVARLKLDWWREELQRAQSGSARHPLAAVLTASIQKNGAVVRMHSMLDAIEDDILRRQPSEVSDFDERCDRLGGAFGELLAIAIGEQRCDTLTAARNLGGFSEVIHRIDTLSRYLRRDYCPLPRQTRLANRLDAAMLRAGHAAELPSVLHDISESRARLIEQILCEERTRIPVTPAHRLAAQALALRRKLARRDYPVLNQSTELLPLQRLWAAWRLR